jgi:uncharacterized glyoxalase superfamily protein PhnB
MFKFEQQSRALFPPRGELEQYRPDDASEADAYRNFDALAAGGTVGMPHTKTFWSPCFGMVTDKFNITWMVMVPSEPMA